MGNSATGSIEERLARAALHVRSGELAPAEQLLAGVLAEAPGHLDARHFLGVLRHEQGRSDEALALIGGVLEERPQHSGAWNNLGNVLIGTGRMDAAQQAYENAIEAAGDGPDAAGPLANLSHVHRHHGRRAEAEAACRRAIARVPDFAEAWYGLSQVLIEGSEDSPSSEPNARLREGLLAYSRAVSLWPQHLTGRAEVLRALLLLGETDRAAEMFRQWLAEEPDNVVVQHLLAACTAAGGAAAAPERASDAYVEKTFDAFAESFDAKLANLRYRAPQLVAEVLAQRIGGAPAAALDLCDAGCGTGLCGPLLRPWARYLAGCDLSTGMLRRAVPRRCYDVLHQAELMHYLNTQPARFDAVVSADTLCYFGDLHAPLQAAARALRPGGWLVFTVEALDESGGDGTGSIECMNGGPGPAAPGYRLQTNGRYAHGRGHVQGTAAAAGFCEVRIEPEVLRQEGGRPVKGWMASMKNAGP
jgi:predicted TPR repeat methyltransferase